MSKKNPLKIDYINNFVSFCFITLTIGVVVTFSSIRINGQILKDFPEESNTPAKDTTSLKKDSSVIAANLNSVKFSLENIFDTLAITDTLLSDDFPYFNDVDRVGYPVVDNGYIGSSAMPIDGYGYETGFKFGLNQYKIYNIEEKYFHISNVPMTTLYFSPGSQPSEFTTRAKFSKNFKDVSLDINYARISNIGKYKNQINKHTNVDFGLWKGSLGSKFNTFVNIIARVHDENHNGGVEDLASLYQPVYLYRQNVPVYLDNAETRFDNYTYSITEYYRIKDSGTKYLGFEPYFIGNIEYSKGFYKFFDSGIKGDSAVYKSYYIDEIGLRNYLNYSVISSDVSLFGKREKGKFAKIGLKFNRTVFDHEPLGNQAVNQFMIYSKGRLSAAKNLAIRWNAKFYFGDYSGDYMMHVRADYFNKYFTLYTEFQNGLYSPAFYDNNLWLSRKNVFVNDFDKTGETVVSAGFSVRKIGFSASLENHFVSKYIYYDERLLPVQLSKGLGYMKVNLMEKLRIWIINFDNNVFIYKSSSKVKPLPGYTLQSKFYIATFLFKRRLLLKTGVEFNYWDKFNNYGFNPVLGNYFVQNNTELDNYNRLDYFISAKVDEFLFYFRINNVLFNNGKNLPFKVLNYPQNDLFFRLGVQWTLVQ